MVRVIENMAFLRQRLYECGFTAAEIAYFLNCPLKSVLRWIWKQKHTDENRRKHSDFSAYSTITMGAEDELEALYQLNEWFQTERSAPLPTPPDSEVLAKLHKMQQLKIRMVTHGYSHSTCTN